MIQQGINSGRKENVNEKTREQISYNPYNYVPTTDTQSSLTFKNKANPDVVLDTQLNMKQDLKNPEAYTSNAYLDEQEENNFIHQK